MGRRRCTLPCGQCWALQDPQQRWAVSSRIASPPLHLPLPKLFPSGSIDPRPPLKQNQHLSISHQCVCREGEFCRNPAQTVAPLLKLSLQLRSACGKKKSSWAGMSEPPLPTLLWTYPKVSGVACICHSLLALSHCLLSKSQTASISPPGWLGSCYFVLKLVCFFNGYK